MNNEINLKSKQSKLCVMCGISIYAHTVIGKYTSPGLTCFCYTISQDLIVDITEKALHLVLKLFLLCGNIFISYASTRYMYAIYYTTLTSYSDDGINTLDHIIVLLHRHHS